MTAMVAPHMDVQWSFLATPAEAQLARHHLRRLAQRIVGYGTKANDIEQAAAECLSNAVVHGPAGEKVNVRVLDTGAVVRVEVTDQGDELVGSRSTPGLLGETGRGLWMIEMYASVAGEYVDGRGHTVWYEVATR